MNKLHRKLKKHIKLVNKKLQENNRKVVVCKNCGQLIDIEQEKVVVEYNMETQNTTFLCESCNEKFVKEMEERDRIFKENCPKHYDCGLWCITCKDKENCSYFKRVGVEAMSRLEEKLIELGYEKREYSKVQYFKRISGGIIHLDTTDLESTYIEPAYIIHFQQDIDNLQQAFNTMQKDLEILKECEE